MMRSIERLLNLHRGDLGRGALFFFYLFLIIATYVVGKVARDALFLDRFQAVQLPYADIAIAVLVGFVVASYLRIGRHASLRNLQVGSLLFFALICVLFWWLAHYYQLPWLYPVIYIWVGIFGVLAAAQVWTLANYALTTREAKRLFGLVGSGAISGQIFAGFFSKATSKSFGTEHLLLGMALFLAISAVLVVFICRRKQATLGDQEEPEEAISKKGPQNLRESLRLIWSSNYLLAIAALICLSSVVTTMAGWQFKAIAKQNLVEKDVLAAFFGDFAFGTGILALLTQLLLTSRVLRRFGIGPALSVVPLALLIGSFGVLVWGTLVAAVMLKGSDQVLRYSIDKTTVELLYLPLPASVRIQVKSCIDTVIWRMGDGLAGLTLLFFATYLHLSASQVSWVNLVLILGWLTAAFVARRQYVAELRENIHEHRLDAERASVPVLDRSTTEIFATNLHAPDTREVLYALSLFEVSRNQTALPAVRDLLSHPTPEVRQKAIAILAVVGDKTALLQIEGLLNDPDFEVRTEALLYVARYGHIDPLVRIQKLGDFPNFSIRSGIVAFLARPGPEQDLRTARLIFHSMVKESGTRGRRTRLEAARLIGVLPDHFDEELRLLLSDPDIEVKRETIRAVGNLRKRRFIPRVLDLLAEPRLAPDITEVLVVFGDLIVGALRDHLGDPAVPIEARRAIASVLGRIGTSAAETVLVENLLESDTTLRFRIISSLNKIHQLHPELKLDAQMIETVLAAEITGHYRSYQILGTLGQELETYDPAARALRESMNQEVERIFRLLGLLLPRYDLHSAYFGLQSSDPVVHDNALEFLDNILKPQIRNVLVPLLDSEVSPAERVRLANRLVGVKVGSCEEAVAALIYSEDLWLKSCGAYAIGKLGLSSLEKELDSFLSHPDPLLSETARQAKLRLASLSEATTA